ncbi:MAG: metallopeptidase TldD-related protein [Oligoflexia bacterium]|nr:metallopeptidase TldD-related protein [Oligoflexia bacterium]
MKDILKYKTAEYKVKIENNEVSAFRSKSIEKTGARVFSNDGKVSIAAQIGECSEEKLFQAAEKNKEAALPVLSSPVSSEKKSWSNLQKNQVLSDSALNQANEHLDLLTKELPNFLFQGQILNTEETLRYTNSNGADLSVSTHEYSFTYDVRRKGSPNIADGFFFHEELAKSNARENLDWSIELFKSFDNEVKIKPGRKKILMLPDEAALDKLGESLRADYYCEDTALYAKKMGKQIFNHQLSIVDSKMNLAKGVYRPFDCEGTVTKEDELILLKNGEIVNLISDLKNQKKHNIQSTGNGFRRYNSAVHLSFSHLSIAPGKRSFREILKSAGEVYISFMGFGGDLTGQGDYSSPIQLAFLSNNGVIEGKLPQIAVTSHLEKMFGSHLLEIAKDGPYKYSSQPYLLVEMDVQLI